MNFEITEGVVNGAQKVVFYGPEGIGKTKFASKPAEKKNNNKHLTQIKWLHTVNNPEKNSSF